MTEVEMRLSVFFSFIINKTMRFTVSSKISSEMQFKIPSFNYWLDKQSTLFENLKLFMFQDHEVLQSNLCSYFKKTLNDGFFLSPTPLFLEL